MVLLKVVRYFILDQCLTVFFDQLEKNLKVDNLEKIPVVGEFYSRLVSKDGSEIFFNCKILDVYQADSDRDFYIDFEYEDYDYIDITSLGYNSAESYLEDEENKGDDNAFDYSGLEDDDDDFLDDDDDDVNTDTVLFSEFNFIK